METLIRQVSEHTEATVISVQPLSQKERLLLKAQGQAPKTSSKSSNTPALVSEEAKPLTDKYPEIVAAFKDAEDRKSACNNGIIAIAEPLRLKLSQERHECLSSIRINGVLYICSGPHYMKALKGPRIAEVMDLFGERFDKYFETRCKLSKPLTPAQIAALDAAGIEYEVEVVGTDSLQTDRTLDEGVRLACENGLPELPCSTQVRVK